LSVSFVRFLRVIASNILPRNDFFCDKYSGPLIKRASGRLPNLI
jgi:hypothetical protein